MGDLEKADLLLDGAGEGAFFMTEQLAFKKIFRKARRMDRHERPFAPALQMYPPGQDLLADACFPQQQYGGL